MRNLFRHLGDEVAVGILDYFDSVTQPLGDLARISRALRTASTSSVVSSETRS